jgi:Sulfotransferase family
MENRSAPLDSIRPGTSTATQPGVKSRNPGARELSHSAAPDVDHYSLCGATTRSPIRRRAGTGHPADTTRRVVIVARFPGVEEILAIASRRSGLDDFGDDDFLPGLEVLREANAENPYVNDAGRRAAVAVIIDALVARAESEACWKRDTRWRTTKVARPLFVVGLPRSGTTALHKLIASDPNTQSLEYWLGLHPQPRPPRATWERNAALVATKAALEALYSGRPEMRAKHDMQPDEPDECRLLRMQSLVDITFEGTTYVPRYRDWLLATDHRHVYARYEKNLRFIGCDDQRRWALKNPAHLMTLDVMLERFPDACIVHIHRAPEQIIPSVCSLRSSMWRLTHDNLPNDVIGQHNVTTFAAQIDRALDVREYADPKRFYDVDYRAFVSDPIGTVEGIYTHFGFHVTEDTRHAAQLWADQRPQGRLGEHRYASADYGLSDDAIRDRFRAYRERFDLP